MIIRKQFQVADDFPAEIAIQLGPETQVHFGGQPQADIRLLFPVEASTLRHPLYEHFKQMEVQDQVGLTSHELAQLKFYLPYAALGFFGRKLGKCYTISHFAQTLDGRIATCTGDSKWIGNEENLLHAHRMRALCDGIVVGAATLRKDNPRLNVRKVKGDDPVKVIIGGNGELNPDEYYALGPGTLMYKEHRDQNETAPNVLASASEVMAMSTLRSELCDRKIHSVYIEGGSFTTSAFFRQDQLDQIQLHFAPKIIGAGVQSFAFEGINQMQDAVTFKECQFMAMGDEMMFVGNL